MSEPVVTISMQQLADALLNTSADTLKVWAELHESGGEPGDRPAGVTRWHCYTMAYEALYSADVDAAGPNEAAVMAAEQTGKDGTWTVIPGLAAQVQLTERHSYEVTGFAPDLRTTPARTASPEHWSSGPDPLLKPPMVMPPGAVSSGLGAAYVEAAQADAPPLIGSEMITRADWLASLEVWTPPTSLLVGKGGPGGNPTIPLCPVCGAYGGGGHGGGCPNSGKPLLDWVRLDS
jgi:hypothetical protein